MQKTEIYKYYRFGFNYWRLLHESTNLKCEEFYDGFKEYLDFIDELKLSVTKSGISLNHLLSDFEEITKIKDTEDLKGEIIDSSLHSKIIGKLKKIDNILDAELNIRIGYTLDEKRYSIEILTEGIQKIFGADVYQKLPPIAQYDFKEAGLCLAFDRYTAAAFHALRGTEDVLKYYYSKLLGVVPKSSDTWGSFMTGINKKIKTIKPVPPEELLINLESLRKYYRNRTQHPDQMYNSDDVQDLIALCVKTVNEINKDLGRRGIKDLADN